LWKNTEVGKVDHCLFLKKRLSVGFFCFFGVVLEFKIRVLCKYSTAWATPPALFPSGCFCIWSLFFTGWSRLWFSYFIFPVIAVKTGTHDHAQLLDVIRVSWTFCWVCPWAMILLISASQVTRITSVSHQHLTSILDLGNEYVLKSR
jgi:hypothetical protein